MNLEILQTKNKEDLVKLAEALDALEEKQKFNLLKFIFPEKGPRARDKYKPAMKFMAKGKDKRFRVYIGGNRSGKSFTCGVELAYHVLGQYPDWWEGRRFKRLQNVWIVAESGKLFRDSLQQLLFGAAGADIGTGLLPLAEHNNGVGIIKWSGMEGTAGGIGTCWVRNAKGRTVAISIKTNEMSREQFQAAKVGLIFFDEEPKEEIYTECLLRLMGTDGEQGIAMMAFTPLKGLSPVVLKFLPNGQFPERGSPIENQSNYVCRVEWQDVPHLSEEDKAEMLQQIPVHERDTRTRGLPTLGLGKIYPVPEDFIFVKPFPIPEYWPRAYGLDFATFVGWTAAVWITEDPATKIRYVYAEYKRKNVSDDQHVMAIRSKGNWIPGIADPSGGGRRDNGALRIQYYRDLGLDLVPGDNSFLTGISSILNRLESGQYKIFETCEMLRNEIRTYRFDPKDPNKAYRDQDDHECDAWRYCDSQFEYVAKSYEDTLYKGRDNGRKAYKRDSWTGY